MKEIKDKIYGELLQANQQEGWKDRRKELLEVGGGKNKWQWTKTEGKSRKKQKYLKSWGHMGNHGSHGRFTQND